MSWKSLLEMGEAGELHPFIDYGTDNDIQEILKPEDFAPEDVGIEKAHNLQLHVQECENIFFKNMLHNMSHKWAVKNSNKQFKKEPFVPLYKATLLTVKLDPEGYSIDATCELLRSRKECPQKAYRLLQNICSAINSQSLKAYKNSKLFNGVASLSEKTHIQELELEREEFIHWLERSYTKEIRKAKPTPKQVQVTGELKGKELSNYMHLVGVLISILCTNWRPEKGVQKRILEKFEIGYAHIPGLGKGVESKMKNAREIYLETNKKNLKENDKYTALYITGLLLKAIQSGWKPSVFRNAHRELIAMNEIKETAILSFIETSIEEVNSRTPLERPKIISLK